MASYAAAAKKPAPAPAPPKVASVSKLFSKEYVLEKAAIEHIDRFIQRKCKQENVVVVGVDQITGSISHDRALRERYVGSSPTAVGEFIEARPHLYATGARKKMGKLVIKVRPRPTEFRRATAAVIQYLNTVKSCRFDNLQKIWNEFKAETNLILNFDDDDAHPFGAAFKNLFEWCGDWRAVRDPTLRTIRTTAYVIRDMVLINFADVLKAKRYVRGSLVDAPVLRGSGVVMQISKASGILEFNGLSVAFRVDACGLEKNADLRRYCVPKEKLQFEARLYPTFDRVDEERRLVPTHWWATWVKIAEREPVAVDRWKEELADELDEDIFNDVGAEGDIDAAFDNLIAAADAGKREKIAGAQSNAAPLSSNKYFDYSKAFFAAVADPFFACDSMATWGSSSTSRTTNASISSVTSSIFGSLSTKEVACQTDVTEEEKVLQFLRRHPDLLNKFLPFA